MEHNPVPHATVVEIARAYRELALLQKQQATTMASMIRACLSRLDRKSTGFERVEDMRRTRDERLQALQGLRDLADMLEAKGATE